MIGLSTETYDVNGAVLLAAPLESPYQAQRRGTVTATLDGASSVYDGGYSVSDATHTVLLKNPSAALLQRLHYLVSYYPELRVCTEIGAYTARVSFAQRRDTLTLNLRLLVRLDS